MPVVTNTPSAFGTGLAVNDFPSPLNPVNNRTSPMAINTVPAMFNHGATVALSGKMANTIIKANCRKTSLLPFCKSSILKFYPSINRANLYV